MMEIRVTAEAKTLKQKSTDHIWRIVSLFSEDASVYIESMKE